MNENRDEDTQTVLERAKEEVNRVPMRDRDKDLNVGLDLTTPEDNAPASKHMPSSANKPKTTAKS